MPAPFQNQEFTFIQPDGHEFKVKGWGNQLNAVFETLDGYTVVIDPATRFYHYAELSAGGSLQPAGKKVGKESGGTRGSAKHLRAAKSATRALARDAFDATVAKCRWQERREESGRLTRDAMAAARAPPARGTTGSYVGLCILIDFPDERGTIPQSEIDDFCNRTGYTGYGNNGSVHDYFHEVSGGRLDYTNIVTAYYTAKHKKSYYTDPSVEWIVLTRVLINEALKSLAGKKFDFSRLSVDEKGCAYSLNIYYAGRCANNYREGLWPHSSNLGVPFPIGNGRMLMDYQITDMGDAPSLGTFCHENGHMLCDFPDLYDYGGESLGVGAYCVMGYGGNISPNNPPQVCAYLKYKAGWADSAGELKAGNYSLSGDKNEFYVHRKSPTEYFILENRRREGRDIGLPAAGLAIWHVDEHGNHEYEDMTPAKHYECSLEQADGRCHLERRDNYGDAQDLFISDPGFGTSTAPNSDWWDGTASKLSIKDIRMENGTVSFTCE